MRVRTRRKSKLLAIMLIAIMLISVGYAFLSSNLTINGTATVKNNSWNIYFTNVVPTAGGVTPTTAPTTSGTSTTTLTWVVSMDTPGQFYEFTVDAVNAGTIDAMIGNLSNSTLTTDQAKYLDYTVTYSDGAPIEQYDILAANGGTEKLKVRVEFKKDVTANDLPSEPEQITFTYTSQYIQADNNVKDVNRVKRWDPVAYNPGSGSISNSDITLAGATLNGTINASSATNWVVLDVTDDGDVLIIPTTYSTTTLNLVGMNGYNNAIPVLNQVASIYKNDTYAESARSIKVEDVNKVENYTPSRSIEEYSFNHRYGMNLDTLDIVDYGVGNEAQRTYKTDTLCYSYSLNNSSSYLTGDCWLASRSVDPVEELGAYFCQFGVYRVEDGTMRRGYAMFDVYNDGSSYDDSGNYAVLPVVTLKSGIHMEKVNGTWTLTE